MRGMAHDAATSLSTGMQAPPPPAPDTAQSKSAWPVPLHDCIDALGAAMDDTSDTVPGREASNDELATIARSVVRQSRALGAACDALVANPPPEASDILQAQAENEAARLDLLEAFADLKGVSARVSGVLDVVCADVPEEDGADVGAAAAEETSS